MTPTAGLDQPWTIGSLLDWTAAFLLKKGAESPRLTPRSCSPTCWAAGASSLHPPYEPAGEDVCATRYRELIRRRTDGCPVAYLVGQKEFFSLTFELNRACSSPARQRDTSFSMPALARTMAEPPFSILESARET